ncbi:MAG: electron transfer flavoprotein subunit beta/FixA family protein [Xanthobacteraceae bacterium]
MKVVVCVKTSAGAAVSPADAFERGGRVGVAVLPPFDAHAVEEALRIVERSGSGEVVAVSVAPAETLGAVREALALGAHRGVILSDPALARSDILGTSRALAALLARERADLYLTCSWSGDIDGTLLWVAAAERLKLPALTQARSLFVADRQVVTTRQYEGGDVTMAASLPCLVEVTETINKPRYPTIKSKLAAKSKPIDIVRLRDLALSDAAATSGSHLVKLNKQQQRRQPIVIDDKDRAPQQIIEFLEARNLL